jgi:hypothetical protein
MGLLHAQLERVLGELEKFLDESSELADAAPLLGQDLLGVGCTERASLRRSYKTDTGVVVWVNGCRSQSNLRW